MNPYCPACRARAKAWAVDPWLRLGRILALVGITARVLVISAPSGQSLWVGTMFYVGFAALLACEWAYRVAKWRTLSEFAYEDLDPEPRQSQTGAVNAAPPVLRRRSASIAGALATLGYAVLTCVLILLDITYVMELSRESWWLFGRPMFTVGVFLITIRSGVLRRRLDLLIHGR